MSFSCESMVGIEATISSRRVILVMVSSLSEGRKILRAISVAMIAQMWWWQVRIPVVSIASSIRSAGQISHAVPVCEGTPGRENVWSMPIVVTIVVVVLVTTMDIVMRSTWRTEIELAVVIEMIVRILVGTPPIILKTHIFGILVIDFLVNEIVLIQNDLILLDLGNF